jgi:hypothetical protein
MTSNQSPGSRRRFLERGSRGLALVATVPGLLGGAARAAESGRNPFAYDIERYRRTDPALIGYDPVRQYPSPRPEPHRLGIGPGDRLHLAAGNLVAVLDSEGRVTSEVRCGGPVCAVAVGGDGTIHAALRDHLELYDPKGKRLSSWAVPEGRPFLTGVAVGERDVLVADAGNRVIWRHDRLGKPLGVVGRRDPDRNIPGLVLPSPFLDVEIGVDGLLRVNNPGRHRVELYTLDGRLELAWGRPSMAMEGFCGCCNPVNLAMLPDGRTVTFEKGIPRVKVYEATGAFDCVVAGAENFADTGSAEAIVRPDDRAYGGLDGVVDSSGRVIILDPLERRIHVMEPRSAPATRERTAEAAGRDV